MNKTNDICERCLQPVFVPPRAVRCEFGCCIRDADGNDRVMPAHECPCCAMETHRLPLTILVTRMHASNGAPAFLTPKYTYTGSGYVRHVETK